MTDRRPRVYVVQHAHVRRGGSWEPKFSLDAVAEVGDVVVLAVPAARADDPDVVGGIADEISRMDPSVDRMLLTGNPALIGVAYAAASRLDAASHVPLVVLRWDGDRGEYREIDTSVYPDVLRGVGGGNTMTDVRSIAA